MIGAGANEAVVANAPAPRGRATSPTREIAAIRTDRLTRRFGEILAVDALDLEIRAGELFGLLGPNGAGKTTTIKMLTTLLPPSGGSATVAGADVTHESGLVRSRIGYVPQLISADGALTGLENIELSARLYHLSRQTRDQRIPEVVEFMALGEAVHRLARTYSGGMIRRLELAMAMLHRPAVLFMDEPTLGLDPTARTAVWDHVLRLREAEGTTILLTTHYMDEAEELCDRLAIMHRGRIAAIGSAADLEAEVGPGATLEDVFARLTGAGLDSGGTFRDIARARRTASRLG
jgi:ABC-2 type transport system ATP-binding protein